MEVGPGQNRFVGPTPLVAVWWKMGGEDTGDRKLGRGLRRGRGWGAIGRGGALAWDRAVGRTQ